MTRRFLGPIVVALGLIAALAGADPAAHPVSRASAGLAISPWLTASGGGGKRIKVPLAPSAPAGYLNRNFSRWAPSPDRVWRRAPNPRAIGYHHTEEAPCEETAAYLRYQYFKTTLTTPTGKPPASARLTFRAVGDAARVTVNGKPVAGFAASGGPIAIGPLLHPGPNLIVVLLADWCGVAALDGAKFTVRTTRGDAPIR